MKRLIIGLLSAALLLTVTACTGGGTTIKGPTTIKDDELSVYSSVIDGATPLLGFARVWWFVDLDNDRWPDTNERFQEPLWVEINRFGAGDHLRLLQPLRASLETTEIPDSVKMST